MRNLKKVLSLVLCLAMMLSIMVVGAGAAFTDQGQFDGRYAEASEVLSNLSVLKGYEDGSFKPKGEITRAEVAAMIYRIATGDVTDAKVSGYAADNQFKDVKSDDWFAGYVNYCASVGYIKGYGDGNFGPQDKVTGYQALAMILRAMGYDQKDEFTGSQWILNTAATAESRGILQNVRGEDLNAAAVRELVAELIFQSMVIPTVTYTPALGYNQYDSIVVNGSNRGNLNPTLGEKAFGLQKTAGEITAVGRTAGTTELITSAGKNTVEGTDTSWTDIGYGAYVWTVATSGAKTRTAVSDVVITGESLKVTTDGTAIDYGKVDTRDGYNVYLNGVLQTKDDGDAVLDNLSGIRGVKVDYIDNDGQGLAEVIVVTQYTVAWVTAITTADTTTGTQGVKESTTYLFDGQVAGQQIERSVGTRAKAIPVADSKLVTNDTLAVGDCVTYVEYADDYYVDLAAATAAKFSARNVSSGAETTYTIGGSNYYISGLEYVTDTNPSTTGAATAYLNTVANQSKNVVIYTDPYGYIVYAEAEVVPDSYLYVISNNATVANTGLTETVVAFTDGTIDTIQVKSGTVTNVNVPYRYDANQLAGEMRTYTVNSDGSYNLGEVQTLLTNGSYKNGTATFYGNGGPVAVDTASVVVDLRDYEVGDTSAEVFTGYNEIPTVSAATLWFTAERNGLKTGNTITYSFLLENTNDIHQEFIVYQTTDYTQVLDKSNEYVTSYKMDVIIDGAVVEDYVLTPDQFNTIKTYGVGIYEFTLRPTDPAAPEMISYDYTSFYEVWGTATWNNGRLTVNGTNYTYTSENQISVIEIGEGLTSFAALESGANYRVYLVNDGTAVEHAYVILGGVVNDSPVAADNLNGYRTSKTINHPDGSTTTYYVRSIVDDLVTLVKNTNAETHNIYIDGLYYQSVESGKTIALPNGTVGTGYSLNGTYYAYGASYTVPVLGNSADISFTSGFVKFTIDGVAKPVKFSNTHVNVKDLIGDKAGTYVWSDWGTDSDYNSVATGTHVPNCDHDITTGFFKVTNNTDYTVAKNGVVQTGDFFVTGTDVVVAKNNATQVETTYGAEGTPITGDITIG